MRYDDELGNRLKEIEWQESGRAALAGEALVVRVDGVSFSKFTQGMKKPYDEVMAHCMLATATKLVEDFNPSLAYCQSDEITLIFAPLEEPSQLPFAGRLQKFASVVAAKATAAFVIEAMSAFPEQTRRKMPAFDGRANAMDPAVAAQHLVWREIDARRNAVIGAMLAVAKQSDLQNKSVPELKAMLVEAGVDFVGLYPEHFRRGTMLRRRKFAMRLSENELDRIPQQFREQKREEVFHRSKIAADEGVPPCYLINNLEAYVFAGESPRVEDKPFATHVFG